MVPSANQATPHDRQSLHPSFLLLGTAFAPVQWSVRISKTVTIVHSYHTESFYLLIFREKVRETKFCLECGE